jgi:SAM-dependent methyltransferase
MKFLQHFRKLNPSRIRLEEFVQEAAIQTPEGALILDAGSGEGYYKSYFTNQRYHATDLLTIIKKYGSLSYISNLHMLPIQSCVYDAVICTQVLEHVSEPDKVIGEFSRILKTNGYLWLTTPLYFPEHEVPYDFYRYTQYGLKWLLAHNGFEVIEMNWLEGFFATLMFQSRYAAKALLSLAIFQENILAGILLIIPMVIMGLVSFVLSYVFLFMEMIHKFTSRGMCKNYTVTAVKR